MILSKKKWSNRIRILFGFLMAAITVSLVLSIAVSAETVSPDTMLTMPDMSDMMPDGTNIPDSNIGGAVESTSPLENITLPDSGTAGETPFMSMPSTNNGTVPSSDIIGGSGTSPITDNPETNDSLGRVLGIIIAVIVVLAVIMLIVALVPKRVYDSKNRNGKS